MTPRLAGPISGRKGGGSTPVEASDTLRSTQRAEIIDLLGEGRIGGLVNGRKSIFLDGVPVENADGSLNFAEFGCAIQLGGPTGETPRPFDTVQSEHAVGVTVTTALPVVRTISDPNVDAIRVTIAFPALVQQQSNGNRVGTAVEWAVDVQSAGGGYVQRYTETVDGKASALYPRAVRIDLKATGPAPWDVRVRRITADSGSADLVNAFAWQSYTAITSVRMLYRNSAAVWITFDAKNFQTIPTRTYDVVGISDWLIPNNYNPLARTVSGSWSGTFTQGWTNNPAWVLYNLVANQRYGLGQYVPQLPDKWTLHQLQQWCDVQVPDGRGGLEPRFTVNAEIREQVEALRLLQELCNLFRGVLTYAGSTLGVAWDAPADPVAIFSTANVVDGVFNYQDGPRSAKKSSCTCWFTDLAQMGKWSPATWDEPSLTAKYGVRPMEIKPQGITSRGQALRMAKWALLTTELEDQTVAFRIGAQGCALRVGDVFGITDPSETGEQLGGRVRSATTAQVQLDRDVTLIGGETYTLWVTLPDPADNRRLIVQARAVTTGAGVRTVLDVSPAFTSTPPVQTMWVLEANTVKPTLWKCVGISEVPVGEGGALNYEVAGVAQVDGKWDLIELDQPLTPRPTRRLADTAPKPTGIAVDEEIYVEGAVARIRASVSWAYPAPGLRYVVTWRLDKGPWTTLAATSQNTVDIEGLSPGVLDLKIHSINALANTSPQAEYSSVLDGKVNPSADVTGLGVYVLGSGVRLVWDANPEGDWKRTELRVGASWAAGTLLFTGKVNEYVELNPPPGTYTVWAKHFDYHENASANAVSIGFTVSSGGGLSGNKVFVQAAAPTGQGEAEGDIWFDSDDGYKIYSYDGAAWFSVRDASLVNFDTRNDRISTAVVAPTVAGGGTAVDHVINANASADVSFEWSWAGTEAQIDGFQVVMRFVSTAGSYTIGSVPAEEHLVQVPANRRAVFARGVDPTQYMTFGVRAYRVVDGDIDASGVLYSAWAQPALGSENPYRPASAVAWTGDLTGTVNGRAATAVASSTINFDARNDRISTAVVAPTITADGTAVDHVANPNGSVDVSLEWGWAGTEAQIDGFQIAFRGSTNSSSYGIGSTPAEETILTVPANKRAQIFSGLNPNSYYTFGVRAFRTVDPDINAAGTLYSAWVQPSLGGGSGENPYRPSASVVFAGDVSGTIAGVPAANASDWNASTSDLTLIVRGGGITVAGNSITKTSSTGWNTEVYSAQAFIGGAYASCLMVDTTHECVMGLNADPTSSYDQTTLDAYWHFAIGGGATCRTQGGVPIGGGTTYAAGDVFSVTYDGNTFTWLKNNAVVASTAAASSTLALHLEAELNTLGTVLKGLRYGPMTARTRIYRQSGDPASVAAEGDIWQNTTSGKELKRVGGAWVDTVGPLSVGTSEIAANAATNIYMATNTAVSVTGGLGIPTGTFTDLVTLSFTPTATCDASLTVAGDGVAVTPASGDSATDTVGDLSTSIWINDVLQGELRNYAFYAKPGFSQTVRGTISRTLQFAVTSGVPVTVKIKGQKLSSAVTTQVPYIALRAEVIKK